MPGLSHFSFFRVQLSLGAARNGGSHLASAAGMDTSNAQSAYNDVVSALKSYQNLSIVNTGVNSGTSVDLKHFWYFNDLDGDDQYKVDIHNGTTKETREWIRTNVSKWFAE